MMNFELRWVQTWAAQPGAMPVRDHYGNVDHYLTLQYHVVDGTDKPWQNVPIEDQR